MKIIEEVQALPPIDIEKYTIEDDLMYQQKKDQIKNNKTNQQKNKLKKWLNSYHKRIYPYCIAIVHILLKIIN